MLGRASAFLPALGLHEISPLQLAPTPPTCHRVTPLFPFTTFCPAAHRAHHARLAVCSSPVSPLSTYLSQTPSPNFFPCTSFQETPGGWEATAGSSHFGLCDPRRTPPPIQAKPFALILFCTLLHFFALRKIACPFLSIKSTLFAQNMGGRGVARHSSLATRHFFHGTRVTEHGSRIHDDAAPV